MTTWALFPVALDPTATIGREAFEARRRADLLAWHAMCAPSAIYRDYLAREAGRYLTAAYVLHEMWVYERAAEQVARDQRGD